MQPHSDREMWDIASEFTRLLLRNRSHKHDLRSKLLLTVPGQLVAESVVQLLLSSPEYLTVAALVRGTAYVLSGDIIEKILPDILYYIFRITYIDFTVCKDEISVSYEAVNFEDQPEIVETIYRYDLDIFSQDVTNLQIIKNLARNGANNVCAIQASGGAMVAFYIFAMLGKEAVERIMKGQIRGINDFSERDFCDMEDAQAIYISDVAMIEEYIDYYGIKRELLMRVLCSIIRAIIASNGNIRNFYCRPVTDEGKKLAFHYGFEQCFKKTENGLYHLHLSQGCFPEKLVKLVAVNSARNQ